MGKGATWAVFGLSSSKEWCPYIVVIVHHEGAVLGPRLMSIDGETVAPEREGVNDRRGGAFKL